MAQWEYAVVTCWKDETWVKYLHPNGGVTGTKSWKKTQKGDPVFEGILAYLGGHEWELVSVQHGLASTGLVDGGILRADDIVAYLKRAVLTDRRTDEPRIPVNLWS